MQNPWQGRKAALLPIPASVHVTLHVELSDPHKPCGTTPASCCAVSQFIFHPSGSWRCYCWTCPLCVRVYTALFWTFCLSCSFPCLPFPHPGSTGLDFTGATVSVSLMVCFSDLLPCWYWNSSPRSLCSDQCWALPAA